MATASAFIITTNRNIDAVYHLVTEIKFKYVLQAIFADEVLEKFFGQTQERIGGNLYIDIGMSQQLPKLSIYKIFWEMTYFLLEIMNLVV